MKLRPVFLAVLALVASIAAQSHAQEVRRSYIVQLADKPVASYTGDVAGLPATKPAAGQQLNVSAADVQAYIGYLNQKQASVQATVAAAPVLHNYKLVFNGFAAKLTASEVRALKKNAGVTAITVDEERELQTNYTPTFLGLDKPGSGLWAQLGGKQHAGEGIIIGIVDGGIWPENKGYADRIDNNGKPTFELTGTLAYGSAPAGWSGSCETGEGFTTDHCNNKLIGARYFKTGFDNSGRPLHWTDFVSPRDSVGGPEGHGGHGTHTSTTSGGNAGVEANLNGVGIGEVSGIAPRARIASYKVCWTYPDPTNPDGTRSRNGCFGSDTVAGIEQAVEDGVHVINYSISGSQTDVLDPIEVAFYGAANAGVFVAASAGNSGPGNAVAHISPWTTTVAASTHNRYSSADLTLSNGATYNGTSYNQAPLPATPMILAADAGLVPYANLSAADKTARRLCYTATDRNTFGGTAAAALDVSLAGGKVVICDRGTNARTDKSVAVAQAGGAGMILADSGAGLVADPHTIPTVHISQANGVAVKAALAANAATTAAMGKSVIGISPTLAPMMAGFSSRGPNQGDLNILKPDLTAPGVDILAGVSQLVSTPAQRDAIANGTVVPPPAWASYQGTSMSSPHVAGLAALLKQQHPTWSPAAIKSALMTTAFTTYNDNQPGAANGLLPWAQGAGHVAPNLAADPGLVYDSSQLDWLRYLCGQGRLGAATCNITGSIQAYNLNLPSLTAANVLGKLSLTRTVTNVGADTATYTASATLPDYAVTVTPSTLTLAPGAKGTFTVNLTNQTAPTGSWRYGAVEWSDGVRKVRSPLTARGSAFFAKPEVYSEAATGNLAFSIGSGVTAQLTSVKGGLKAAERTAHLVGQANTGDGGLAECRAGGSAGVVATTVVVPANTLVARFATFDVDTSGYQAGNPDDLDLIVLNAVNGVVGSSGNVTSNEMVTLTTPAAGTYRVCVVGYSPNNGSSTFTQSGWVVSTADTGGNFKVSMPAIVYTGGTATAAASWSGLTPGVSYLGAVQYKIGGVNQGATLVQVDVTDPLPAATSARSKAVIVGRD